MHEVHECTKGNPGRRVGAKSYASNFIATPRVGGQIAITHHFSSVLSSLSKWRDIL